MEYKKIIVKCLQDSISVKTEEEYVRWVRNWKKIHKKLMKEYETNRADKRAAKKNKDIQCMNILHMNKMYMRVYACSMYDKRIAMKENLHAGKYEKIMEAA